jgi:uncharacterized surface protein with fasciclin (FAS1) repeats
MALKRSPLAKQWLVGAASIGVAALMAACGPNEPTATTAPDQAPMATEAPTAGDPTVGAANTVVDVAASDSDFSILVEAIEAADLTEALATGGPITLFAPTNAAFEALPDGALDQLLEPENQDLLRQVLAYHVVQEEVTSNQITPGDVPTAAGTPVTIQVNDATGEVMVNEATVVTADITASNGVIHAVDQVILPPGLPL